MRCCGDVIILYEAENSSVLLQPGDWGQPEVASNPSPSDIVRLSSRHRTTKKQCNSNNCSHVLIVTWNVRGYPETEQDRREWFSDKLIEFSPDIICIQEIANQDRVDKFLANEEHFTSEVFLNSSDGQDNAIFTAEWVEMEDIPDPSGFQHPAQAAYVSYEGFDAVILTVLSYFGNIYNLFCNR